MDWKISFNKKAEKQLDKLSREIRLQITNYLFRRVATEPDPRLLGKALSGDSTGYWRYRVGDYRIICENRNKNFWSWSSRSATAAKFTTNRKECPAETT